MVRSISARRKVRQLFTNAGTRRVGNSHSRRDVVQLPVDLDHAGERAAADRYGGEAVRNVKRGGIGLSRGRTSGASVAVGQVSAFAVKRDDVGVIATGVARIAVDRL